MPTVFPHRRPLADDEYLALGETEQQVELLDGSLLVSARGAPRHQHAVQQLARAFRGGGAGHVLAAVNVRLRPGRILIPDLVVTGPIGFDEPLIEKAAVLMVAEVVTPASAAVDKVLKMHYYAVAGIPWYLLVEQETGALHLYRLSGDHFVEHSVTHAGQVLHLTDPVEATIAPEDLLPPV
jgi:hypothetical protein